MIKLPSIIFICTTPAVLHVTGGLNDDGKPILLGSYEVKVFAQIKRGEVLSGERLTIKEMSRFIFNGSIGAIGAGTLEVNNEVWTIRAAEITPSPDGSAHHTTLYCTL